MLDRILSGKNILLFEQNMISEEKTSGKIFVTYTCYLTVAGVFYTPKPKFRYMNTALDF